MSSKSRRAIQTDAAPAAIGPYSQAIVAGHLLFCSGQIPLDPATGALVGDDAATQTQQVMKNLGAVLEAAGASFGQVVRTTIFLTDLGDFGAVNEVYGSYFGQAPPRSGHGRGGSAAQGRPGRDQRGGLPGGIEAGRGSLESADVCHRSGHSQGRNESDRTRRDFGTGHVPGTRPLIPVILLIPVSTVQRPGSRGYSQRWKSGERIGLVFGLLPAI